LLGAFFGFVSGFLGSMPVTGPIALVVFRSSMRGHFSLALRVVAGAAVAEVIYCALATFGYVQIIAAYPFLAKYIRYVGASFLVVLGAIFMFQKIHLFEEPVPVSERRSAGWLSGFLIAILNPTLFLTWGSASSTIFSWFDSIGFWDMVLFPLCAGLGIVTWFSILLEIFKKYREQIGEKIGSYAIRCAAVVMLVSGTYLLTQAGK
jgi:threonine/homoserine/homoserine lactone efflux protein